MHFLLIYSVVFLTFFTELVTCCPDVVNQYCACVEVHNGVLLDCSNNSGIETMDFIRSHQSSLGLIQSLTLQHVGFTRLPADLFSGLYIKRLDLSENEISEVDGKAFHGMNPVLEELLLNQNLLKKVPSSALTSIPSLLKLDLSNNSILEIAEEDVFPSLNKLYDINLGSNMIQNVHTNSFQNIKNSIQIINLGHNKLSAVPSSAIRGLKQLQSLHLHQNKIVQLDALSFLNLPVLKMLNLAGNQIEELNRQAFLNVPNLRYLYLSGNSIKMLHAHQFQSFEQLEMLDLTKNKISEIPSECLSGLKQLKQIYLGNNTINSISPGAFVNSSIAVLVLSGNNLTELPAGTISGLPNVQQISFRDNRIKHIDRNAFYDVSSLTMLDLARNQLAEIAPSTFLAQLNLLFVDLSENKLKATPYSAFNRRVGTVLLKENPLVCTENIHMLQDGSGVFIKDSPDIICNRTATIPPKPVLTQIPKLQIHRNPSPQRNPQPIIPQNLPPRTDETEEVEQETIPIEIQPDDESSQIRTITLPAREDEELQQHHQHQEEEQEEEQEKESEVLQQKTMPRTDIPAPRPDIRDRPNAVLPFPVPFLKRGPALSRSKSIGSNSNLSGDTNETVSNSITHTLPPSILIEPGSTPRIAQPSTPDKSVEFESNQVFALSTSPSTVTLVPSPSKNYVFPTTIILICVILAVLVLILVIIGLCVNKHRQLRFENTLSDSSAHHRAADYVNSQYHGHKEPRVGRFEESPAWIYNPGAGYCNYYK